MLPKIINFQIKSHQIETNSLYRREESSNVFMKDIYSFCSNLTSLIFAEYDREFYQRESRMILALEVPEGNIALALLTGNGAKLRMKTLRTSSFDIFLNPEGFWQSAIEEKLLPRQLL
jgi:hypothetical protein